MAVPTWSVGQVLTASDVNTWFVPLAVIKPSLQSVTSSTALVNDTALLLAMAANASYQLNMFLSFDGGTTGSSDLKISFTLPSGATCALQINGYNTASVDVAGSTVNAGFTQALATNGANPRAASLFGTMNTSSTSGNLQLQWAQSTSSGTATRMFANSNIVMQRIA